MSRAVAERHLAAVYAHAREAFPLECCGYLLDDLVVRCTNIAASPTSYAIDGAELLSFVRSLDGDRPARVLYHSHTNGRAYLSPRDLAIASTPEGGPVYPVAQLVVGVTPEGPTEAALFEWRDGFVEVARWTSC